MAIRTHIAGAAAVALGALVLVGCAGDPGKQGSKQDVQKVRQAYAEAQIGASREATLELFDNAGVSKLSSARVGGIAVDEYKVEAYHDDDWNKTRELFIVFLYFADGVLADTSDRRIDFRSNPAVVENWAAANDAP